MKLIISLVVIILLSSTISILPTTINGRFIVLTSNSLKYTVLLQINTNTGTDDIGGATIVFGFDTAAISFPNNPVKNVDYIFHNFDGGQYSAAIVTKPVKNRIWVNIDLPFENSNNGTILAGSPGWTDVVTLNFNIVNPNIEPGLCWYLTSLFWGVYDANNITLWETGVFEGNFGLVVEMNNGWNMVSVPGINPNGQGVNNWWSQKKPGSNVYRLIEGYYQPVETTNPREGYWMNQNGVNIYNTGDEWPAKGIQRVSHEPINASTGWNLIGGYENIVQASQITTTPPGLISGPIYTYSDQFQIATILEPGRGYLIKLNGDGQINMPGGLAKESEDVVEYFKEDWGKITITDDLKRNYTLYLVDSDIDFSLYGLPPIPSEDLFDIRFGSGRIVENINNGIQTIVMRGIVYPIKVRVKNISIILQDESGKTINAILKPDEEIKITNESIDKLLVLSGSSATPIKYSLEQNYPNPFNPSTKIKFSVQKESNVNLSIYNILGELVSTLVDEKMKEGYYEYEFNASKLASGVYIYRIKTEDFVETKKMVLMK